MMRYEGDGDYFPIHPYEKVYLKSIPCVSFQKCEKCCIGRVRLSHTANIKSKKLWENNLVSFLDLRVIGVQDSYKVLIGVVPETVTLIVSSPITLLASLRHQFLYIPQRGTKLGDVVTTVENFKNLFKVDLCNLDEEIRKLGKSIFSEEVLL